MRAYAVTLNGETKYYNSHQVAEANRGVDGHIAIVDVPQSLVTVTVDEAAESALQRVHSSMDDSLANGFTCTNGMTVNAGIQDVMLLFLALQKAERGNRPTLTFRDFNRNVQSGVTQSDVNQMLIEAGDNYEAAMANKWTREAEIDAIVTDGVMTDAEKVAALNAIVW